MVDFLYLGQFLKSWSFHDLDDVEDYMSITIHKPSHLGLSDVSSWLIFGGLLTYAT